MGGRKLLVDFEKTLTKDSDESGFGSADNRACKEVRQKYFEGNTIIILSSKSWEKASGIASCLTNWGVPYNGIKCAKTRSTESAQFETGSPDRLLRND